MSRRAQNPRLMIAAVLFGLLAVVVAGPPAGAHSGDQSYLYLDVTGSELRGRVEFPVGDVDATLGLSIGADPELQSDRLREHLGLVQAYADDHLDVGVGRSSFPLEFEGAELLSELSSTDDYVVLHFEADLGGDEVPRVFDVTFDPFFDEIPGRNALVLIANDWGGGVIDNGEEVLLALDSDTRSQTVDLGEASWLNNLRASVELGVDHIRTGPDHVFFVIVLLLPSVLVHSHRRWQPSPSFVTSLWRVLKIVTMFTAAHSITFTLAGLDLIPLPSPKLVETTIALSIAAAALHNLRPIAPNREWAIAFGFGLFHGLGFASLVTSLEVSRSTQLLSLLGRNLGIEIGQVVVVLMVFPILFLLRDGSVYRPVFTLGSVALAAVALVWAYERLAERDVGIGGAVDALIRFPRSLVVAAALTGVAAVVRQVDARRDRPRWIVDDEGDEPLGRRPEPVTR